MNSKLKSTLIYTFLISGAVIMLIPFTWMILTSLKTYSEANATPAVVLPKVPQWSNYPEALVKAPFGRYFINTLFVAVVTTIATVTTAILAGFAFSKLDFKYKGLLFTIMISLLMVPEEIMAITNFQTIAKLGLMDTYIAIILPYAASVLYIYYMRNYFTQIPNSVYKAAKIDGASDWQFLWKILVPMAKPGIITISVLSFIGSWNAFLWPFLVTNSQEMRLLNNGLIAFTSEAGSDPHLQMAAATLIIIPIIVIFILTRKYVMSGVQNTGVKE